MTAEQRQDLIVEEYAVIADVRERFQVIVETAAASMRPFPDEERLDQNLVPGCVSRVWLAVRNKEDGSMDVWVESESPALRGIAALFCRIYSGAIAAEIVATEPDFVARLGIDRHLTPTRLRGLGRLRERLVEKARS